MARSFMVRHDEAAEYRLGCAVRQVDKCRPGFAETRQRERRPRSFQFELTRLSSDAVPRAAAAVAGLLYLLAPPAFAQQDPGVRGGLQNTAGYLQYICSIEVSRFLIRRSSARTQRPAPPLRPMSWRPSMKASTAPANWSRRATPARM